MNLKDFLASRDKPPELYWSLVLEKGWVQAGIWYIGNEAAEVISVSPPAAWEEEPELVGACDAALSSSVSQLPENYDEPSKTVFGVPSSWVKGGEIEDAHLAKIKKVCTDLSLTPVGFVVLPEAIAHLYKAEEGAPLSAVIIGLGTEALEVSVFKLGNLVGTTNVSRSVSLTEDVTEGLSRFEGASPLPSRFIVYDGKGGELEEAREELLKANWDLGEKIKFLHTPKAEVLTSDRKVYATSLAGANEIGNVTQVNANTVNEDPVKEDLPPREEIENVTEPLDDTTPEDLGFAVERDIAPEAGTPPPAPKEEPMYVPVPKPAFVPPPVAKPERNVNYLQKTKSLFHGFSSKMGFSSKIKIPSANVSNKNPLKTLYIALALILILGIGGFVYLWFIPKAVVTVFVSPKTYQEALSMSFSTDGQFDESRAIVPGTLISSTQSGEKTKSTTGTKLVGDKATGTVQVANGNGNPIHLAAGTILTSSGGLRFVTSSEASVSGQLLPGSPGTATLTVTAADIGAQYNLAKGEIFKVGAFDKSQVAGTSQADFSGGSSQQIQAVSADDQKKLESDLKAELSDAAVTELTDKVTTDQIFVDSLSDLSVANETFDHKVGDVADTLKLSLTVNASGVAADRAKLLKYAVDSLQSKIPAGYALRSSQIGFKFTFIGKQNGLLGYNVDINANFLPQINVDELTRKIAGKSRADVENYLTTVPGYVHAEVKIKPTFPKPFALIPKLNKNITIEVAADQ